MYEGHAYALDLLMCDCCWWQVDAFSAARLLFAAAASDLERRALDPHQRCRAAFPRREVGSPHKP